MAGLLKPASQKSKIRRLGNQPTDNPGRNPSTRPKLVSAPKVGVITAPGHEPTAPASAWTWPKTRIGRVLVWFYTGVTSLTVLVLAIAMIAGPPSLASPHAALFSALITGIVSSIASLPLFIPQETRPLAGRLILWSL